jgi:hypothetical protein
LTPGGSSTSHIYTQTVRIIQRKEILGSAGRAPSCELYPGICLTTEEKARKNPNHITTPHVIILSHVPMILYSEKQSKKHVFPPNALNIRKQYRYQIWFTSADKIR